jgi:hypothetical protein
LLTTPEPTGKLVPDPVYGCQTGSFADRFAELLFDPTI